MVTTIKQKENNITILFHNLAAGVSCILKLTPVPGVMVGEVRCMYISKLLS
jgi:hypothetical protein